VTAIRKTVKSRRLNARARQAPKKRPTTKARRTAARKK